MTLYSDEEILRVFQEECRNYYYYQDKLKNLNDQLAVLVNRMENTHSPSLDKVPSATPANADDRIVPYLETKTSLENRIGACQAMLKWIEHCIDEIPYPAYRYMVWQTYIAGDKLSYFAKRYNVSVKKISQNRKKCLLMVLNDDKIIEHDKLQMDMIGAERENALVRPDYVLNQRGEKNEQE